MPENQRPREKAQNEGVRSLSNRELLALLIRSGIAGCSSLMIADELLQKSGNLNTLMRLSLQDLRQIRGISHVKSLEIQVVLELGRRISLEQTRQMDVISNPENLVTWLKQEIGNLQQEHFLAIYLDVKNHILDHKILFKGTLDASIVHPREVFKEALAVSAARFLAVHNHPSGDLNPSGADLIITEKLQRGGKMLGIELLDHLIVSSSEFYSFRAHGLLD